MNDETVLEGGGLSIRFRWRGDRYEHDVWLQSATDWLRVVESCEGTPEESWPTSPPLQSLHVERRGEKQLALLVGMAGHSHWSVSVELDPIACAARFDIACRVRAAECGRLGSRYRTVAQPSTISSGRAVVCVSLEAIIVLSPWPESTAAIVRAAPEGLEIVAPSAPTSEAARTIRWGYALSCTRDGL